MGAVFRGIGASSGIAAGRAFPVQSAPLPVVPTPVPPERLQEEIERFDRARADVQRELEELGGDVLDALGRPYAGILEAQRLILEDPALVAAVAQRIRVGRVAARWALKEVVAEYVRRFDAVGDAYLRERGAELSDVHDRLQRSLAGLSAELLDVPPAGPVIVVAPALGPSDTLRLARQSVVGLLTDTGGPTSHTAILAQALCLPAVVGLLDLSRSIEPGQWLVIDGDSGEVLVEPDAEQRAEFDRRRQALVQREQALVAAPDAPALTRDGVEIVLRANVEFPEEVANAVRFGARGIGLYRSEFLYLGRAPRLPTEDEHFAVYVEIARRVAPHPAIVRTLDVGGEKSLHQVLGNVDTSAVLGLRGIRLCLARPDVFRPQLRALLRAAAVVSNLQVMLPLVTAVEEVREVRALLAREARALVAEGSAVRADLPLGLMIEVPAAAASADLLAAEADFFSIGTNDLIQYALAVDRGNSELAALYQPLHPGLLRLVRWVVESGRRRSIPVAVCGAMAADPNNIEALIGLGLRELSVQPRAVAVVREAVGRVHAGVAEERVELLLGGRGPECAPRSLARSGES